MEPLASNEWSCAQHRLSRCTASTTGGGGPLPRSKPLKHCFEKEIVMYAHFKRLLYFSTECLYAPFAARGFARTYIKVRTGQRHPDLSPLQLNDERHASLMLT
jgi:tRNA(Ile)-lysidine synthase TilS/MesJ